ncbi:MAG: P22 phage major capsid protein family protein [Gallionella sp.]
MLKSKLVMAKVYLLAALVWLTYPLRDALVQFQVRTGLILGVNDFNKEERVAFETILEGFEDALVLSRNVSKYNTDSTGMERQSDIIWRPQPMIAQSHDGTDATANFDDNTGLAVPATLGYSKHSTAVLDAKELRDALVQGKLGEAARQKLASDINVAVMAIAALQGTLVVKRTAAATGYDDVALCEAIMNEQGVPDFERYLALSTRDYNGMASNLAAATRSFGNQKSDKAYERSYVGPVASFDTYKLDYARRLLLAGGGAGITMSTLDVAVNYYVPKAKSTATTGETSNVDNRYQTIAVSATANVTAGDCFTVAALNAVHHITKEDTGQLKTFRVIEVVDGTHLKISPPMITDQVSTDATAQYKNCVINTKAANSAIVFLNTVTAAANPFWQKDAIELLPGSYAIPTDAGVAVMRATTDQGIELVMQKFYDINTMKTKFRWDVFFGVVMKNPEMAGIMLFSQT